MCIFFFFKQKTAYEMRISDWSSDVCSSDLLVETITGPTGATAASGKKAFKTVTAIAVSATTTAAVTVGTGDVLGLPVYLPSSGAVLKEQIGRASCRERVCQYV